MIYYFPPNLAKSTSPIKFWGFFFGGAGIELRASCFYHLSCTPTISPAVAFFYLYSINVKTLNLDEYDLINSLQIISLQ
jgi:hypothetical protein